MFLSIDGLTVIKGVGVLNMVRIFVSVPTLCILVAKVLRKQARLSFRYPHVPTPDEVARI